MRKQKIFQKTIICVNEECFEDSLSAGRYFLELASKGLRVSVNRHVETAGGGSRLGDAEADLMLVRG